MKVMMFFAFLLLSLVPGQMYSQTYNNFENTDGKNTPGRLTIIQDERLGELLQRHIRINNEAQGISGYRIRIFTESGRNARPNADIARANFFNKYPGIETYLDYNQPPNFRVYVGDFRTRSEALKMQRKLSRDYPNSFIVSQKINFPPLD